MLKNYLTIALRNVRKHKGHAAINVGGLAIGMACCLLIFLFVRDELSYDRFHENKDRVYRLVNERTALDNNASALRAATPPGLGPTMEAEFPEVEAATRWYALGRTLVTRDEQQFFEPDVYIVDPSVFDVFTIPLLSGDPATALVEPNALVITETLAEKYFGDEDPVGQTLTLSTSWTFTVTGVMQDWPDQSHLHPTMLASFATMLDFTSEERLQNWIWQQFYTYVLLREDADAGVLQAKLPAFAARFADPEGAPRGFQLRFHLQPLPEVYLHSADLLFDDGDTGNIAYVYGFGLVALFILLIACFNFMNLSTARSMQRAREVGMRKVIGARRRQLIAQFIGESVLLAVVGTVFALAILQLVLPAFNAFAGKALANLFLTDIRFAAGLLGATLFVGLLAGSYPAFFLSSFQPIRVLKGHGSIRTSGAALLRKGLVVTQFAISIALIIGTSVVLRQMQYIQEKNLGFNDEQVVTMPLRGDMDETTETIKAELLRHPGVVSAAASYGLPGEFVAGDDILLPGQEGSTPMNHMIVDVDYLALMDMQMTAGRAFSRDFPSDSSAFIINEAAVAGLGYGTAENALGQELHWNPWTRDDLKRGTVVGVVQDFHYVSLHQQVAPLVMHIEPEVLSHLSVRIRPENVSETMAHLDAVWQQFAPPRPFEYEFLDEELNEQYLTEAKLSRLFGTFALLAIFVACLGLFGLASFTAERRTKEVGVRKVLGASVSGLVVLLTKDFARLVLIAFVVAAPIAYFVMRSWLADFAYHTTLSPVTFALAGGAALLVAVLTVSYQSIKAAVSDPVKSLRYE